VNESSRDIDVRRFQNLLTTSIDQRERETIQRLLSEERNKAVMQTPQRQMGFLPFRLPKDRL
jgi:hypothetical protein